MVDDIKSNRMKIVLILLIICVCTTLVSARPGPNTNSPYRCDWCNIGFDDIYQYREHMYWEHGCDKCANYCQSIRRSQNTASICAGCQLADALQKQCGT